MDCTGGALARSSLYWLRPWNNEIPMRDRCNFREKLHSWVSYAKKLCVVQVWPFLGVSSYQARYGARNGVMETASLQCSSPTLPSECGGWPAGPATSQGMSRWC